MIQLDFFIPAERIDLIALMVCLQIELDDLWHFLDGAHRSAHEMQPWIPGTTNSKEVDFRPPRRLKVLPFGRQARQNSGIDPKQAEEDLMYDTKKRGDAPTLNTLKRADTTDRPSQSYLFKRYVSRAPARSGLDATNDTIQPHKSASVLVFCSRYRSGQQTGTFRYDQCGFADLYECILWNVSSLLTEDTWNTVPELLVLDDSSVESCWNHLAASVRGRSIDERLSLFKAVYTVAISFSFLSQDALFEAVVNIPDAGRKEARSNSRSSLNDSNQLMEICQDLLQTRDDGSVEFRSSPMRAYVLKSDLPEVGKGHSTMAKTCLDYLKSIGSYLILRPWAKFSERLRQIPSSSFLEYVEHYWQKHYRLAESVDNELPRNLHQVIELAVTSGLPDNHDYLMIEIRRMTLKAGLQLSLRYGFKVLQTIYTQMGASGSQHQFQSSVMSESAIEYQMKLTLQELTSKYMPLTSKLDTGSSSNVLGKKVLMRLGTESLSIDRAFDLGQPEVQRPKRTFKDLQMGPHHQWQEDDITSSFHDLRIQGGYHGPYSNAMETSMSSISCSEPRTPPCNEHDVIPASILDDKTGWEMIDDMS